MEESNIIIIVVFIVIAGILIYILSDSAAETNKEQTSSEKDVIQVESPINLPFAVAAVTTPEIQKKYEESGLEQKYNEHDNKIKGYVKSMKKYADDFLNDKISRKELDKRLKELNDKISEEKSKYWRECADVFGYVVGFDSAYFIKLNSDVFGVQGYSNPIQACNKYISTYPPEKSARHNNYIKKITKYAQNMKKFADQYISRGYSEEQLEKNLRGQQINISNARQQYRSDFGRDLDYKYLVEVNKNVFGVDNMYDSTEACKRYIRRKTLQQ